MKKPTHPSSVRPLTPPPFFSCQTALGRLEKGGILASYKEGKTRVYIFNPRYPLLRELTQCLEKAYTFLPEEHRLKYYRSPVRKHPRRKGKPL